MVVPMTAIARVSPIRVTAVGRMDRSGGNMRPTKSAMCGIPSSRAAAENSVACADQRITTAATRTPAPVCQDGRRSAARSAVEGVCSAGFVSSVMVTAPPPAHGRVRRRGGRGRRS